MQYRDRCFGKGFEVRDKEGKPPGRDENRGEETKDYCEPGTPAVSVKWSEAECVGRIEVQVKECSGYFVTLFTMLKYDSVLSQSRWV